MTSANRDRLDVDPVASLGSDLIKVTRFMRVKMKAKWAGAYGSHEAGAIVDLPDNVAASLIHDNYAENLTGDETTFVNLKTFTVDEVCQLTGLTPDMLKDKVEKAEAKSKAKANPKENAKPSQLVPTAVPVAEVSQPVPVPVPSTPISEPAK